MMDITIYQINMGRDYNRVAFQSYDGLERLQGTNEIDSELYDRVFEGKVECDDLEDVYRMFNVDQPEGYRGRSLSVSDVVETTDKETGECKWFYCDSIGFKQVTFDTDLVEDLKEEKITVVLCEPGKLARVTEISNELEGLQSAVKGDIEAFYPYEEEIAIICNEEGKFNGMEPNRAVYGEDGKMMDIIFGPFFICDCSGQNFGSLSQEQLKRFSEQFSRPERFYKMGSEITAVPYEPKAQSLEER